MAHDRSKASPRASESVWDYPRPPRLEPFDGQIQVVFNGVMLASTEHAKRVLETSHPPVYYVPCEDVRMNHLVPAKGTSFCEWKGAARWYDVEVGDRRIARAAWSYPQPTAGFEPIMDHLAFYAGPMDACYVDGERATPQPGNFYGGWITGNIQGPFKGASGTEGW